MKKELKQIQLNTLAKYRERPPDIQINQTRLVHVVKEMVFLGNLQRMNRKNIQRLAFLLMLATTWLSISGLRFSSGLSFSVDVHVDNQSSQHQLVDQRKKE